MSNKNLLILAVVATAMVFAVVIQSNIIESRTSVKGGSVVDSYLIQGLDPARVAEIEIGKGELPLRLRRHGDRFVIENRQGYPADTGRINALITGCLDIRIKEPITSRAENHESLSVAENNCQNLVKFLDEEGKVITGIVVGSSRLPEMQMEGRTTYVRLIDSNDVYLASDVPFSLEGSATDYMDRELISVLRDRIAAVTVSGPAGSYTLRPADSNDAVLVLEEKPEDRQIEQGAAEQVFTALSNLSFEDVGKAGSDDGLLFDRDYTCRLKDSTVYNLQIAKGDEKTYLKCSADFTDKDPVVKEQRVESDEELKAKEAKLLARQAAMALVESTRGWVYEIPDWKAEKLTMDLEGLLEELPEEDHAVADPNTAS